MSSEKAFKTISNLVNDFKANEKHYLNRTLKQMDELAYQLYGLTEEEIKIAEENVK